jgi:hypothetical protein
MVGKHYLKLISILIVCFSIIATVSFAQSNTSDSSSFSAFSFYKSEARFTYGLNNRRTAFKENNSTIFGLYAGVEWGDKLRHVLTFNSTVFWIEQRNERGILETFHLNYIGFAEEFDFFEHNRWLLTSYLHSGLGKYTLRTPQAIIMNETSRWVVPLETGIQCSYNLLPWLRLIAGGGYRWILRDELSALNGVYYKASAAVNLKKLELLH